MSDGHPHNPSGRASVALIAAMAENRVIGRDGELPWRLPDEMRFFVRTTRGHTVVMGRRTFESFGQPLPNRRNIVVTRDRSYAPAGAEVAHSLEDALALAAEDAEVFVAGGAEIYRQSLPRADRLYLTLVHGQPQGDTLFPEFDEADWRLVEQTRHEADDRHAYAFTIQVYDRIG